MITNPLATYDRVVVTGAGGWIGRNAVDQLIDAFGPALGARTILAATTARSLQTPAGDIGLVAMSAVRDLRPTDRTLLLHCGFPTQDQVDAMGERSYLQAVEALRGTMVAVMGRLAPVDMVYLSSGAASSVERGLDVAPRTSVYGREKIADEAAFSDVTHATGGRLCVVRAFALSGPYMTKPETYALGNMILQGARAGTIDVKAARPVRRSYMAIDDMLRVAVHAVGQLPPSGVVTFETAGEVVEMGTLAERILAVLQKEPSTVTRAALDMDAAADDYLGDMASVASLAEAAGVVLQPLDRQIANTAQWLCGGRVP